VVLAQPERDDRDMYAEYLSHMGLRPVCVQNAQDAIRIAPKADVIVTELLHCNIRCTMASRVAMHLPECRQVVMRRY
jgi:hypothetical protein